MSTGAAGLCTTWSRAEYLGFWDLAGWPRTAFRLTLLPPIAFDRFGLIVFAIPPNGLGDPIATTAAQIATT